MTLAHLLERAGDDEENVASIDGLPLLLSAVALEFERGLDLALDIVSGSQGHLGFLHELEQRGLHAAATDVAALPTGGGGDLVHLVDINDAVLRGIDIAIRPLHEIAHEVVDIAAHVAGLAELGGVGLDEGNADQLRNVLDEVRFTDAGGADEDDILLGKLRLAGLAFILALSWRMKLTLL